MAPDQDDIYFGVAGAELQALADNLPHPAWIAYADGFIFWFNRRWYEYTGTTIDDQRGWGWTSTRHPEEIERITAVWKQALADGKPVEITFPLKGRDGIFRLFLTSIVPVRDASGQVVRWFGTNVDITGQVVIEERLRVAEADWQSLFDEMQDGFAVGSVVYDAAGVAVDGTIVKANKQWSFLTGLPPVKAPGTSLVQVAGVAGEQLLKAFARVLESGVAELFEAHIEALGRWLEIRAYRHSPTQVAAFFHDVSERKLAEYEARRAQDNLLRVSRLSAMGALASTLAHELNQPIGAAANYIAAANEHLKRSSDPEKQRLQQLLKSANESCLRAGRIIRSMREFTASGRVTKTSEDLKEMISATIADFLDDEASDGLMFEFVCPNGLPPIMCDRIQIEQVLINLYSNSVRAMATTEARLIRIDVTARPDVVLIRLGDSGPGFTDRSPEELFEPFWSTTDVGLGLGLPLCRTIVEAHGGAIWGERGDPDGACFVIRLPVDQDEPQPPST